MNSGSRLALLALLAAGAHTGAAGAADPWWRDATFYQVFVRSYADAAEGPSAGDGIGDFDGLRGRLDYLNDGDPATDRDLGVDALWLLPVNASPSYHGYDVTDYFAFEPDYGSEAQFRALVAAAHARGIRVIVDLVMNHTSSEHPWFREAIREGAPQAAQDRYVLRDSAMSDAGPWGEPCFHYTDGIYFYGVFFSGMPDLNFRNPEIAAHFRKVARWWLEDIGVDGFRLDAVRYLFESDDFVALQDTAETLAWLRDFRAYCHSIKPDAFIIGEVWADTATVASYLKEGSLDAGFEFDLAKAMTEAAGFGLPMLYTDRLERVRTAFKNDPWGTFLSNHDKPRTLTQLWLDRGKARLAAFLQFTTPGIPFIYYGEEIGMQGDKPDPDIRTPMQWSSAANAGFSTAAPWRAPNADYPEVNVAAEQGDAASLLALYRRLVRWNKAHRDLIDGKPVPVRAKGRGLLAQMRSAGGSHLLLLTNMKGAPLADYSVMTASLPAGAPAAADTLQDLPVNPPSTGESWKPVEAIPPYSTVAIVWPPQN